MTGTAFMVLSRTNGACPVENTVIAVAQLAIAIGEPDANRKAAADAVADAAPADDSETPRQWPALAGEHQLVIVGGFCERGADGRLFNSAALVDASGTRVVYRKAHLWDQEKLVFTPGDAPPPVVETAIGRVGVMICYDLEFPEWVRLAALDGADLIAAPVNWPATASPATAGAPKDGFPPDVLEALADAAA